MTDPEDTKPDENEETDRAPEEQDEETGTDTTDSDDEFPEEDETLEGAEDNGEDDDEPEEGESESANPSEHKHDDEYGDDEPPAPRPEVRMRPKNVEELLLDAVPQRARTAGEKLRMHLNGRTVISLRNSGDTYMLDWSGPQMVTSKTDAKDADCTIVLSEADLMKLSSGDLNPQILMLSHKVHVSGKADHAIYVFNLIAPMGNPYG